MPPQNILSCLGFPDRSQSPFSSYTRGVVLWFLDYRARKVCRAFQRPSTRSPFTAQMSIFPSLQPDEPLASFIVLSRPLSIPPFERNLDPLPREWSNPPRVLGLGQDWENTFLAFVPPFPERATSHSTFFFLFRSLGSSVQCSCNLRRYVRLSTNSKPLLRFLPPAARPWSIRGGSAGG